MTAGRAPKEALEAAAFTLRGAVGSGRVLPLREYARITVEAALPYVEQAHTRHMAGLLEGAAMRVSVSADRDELVKALGEVLVHGPVPPNAEELAQVAYAKVAAILRSGRLG